MSATALLTASLLAISASPAHAKPTGCAAWTSGYFVYSHCTGGTGTHAASAYGKHIRPEIGYVTYIGQPAAVGETASLTFPGTVYSYATVLYD
ncbi:hypothetical protein DP939_18295 [Spongiactinospora rosea]|uniref:Uncharacterized protein n=2 Tax=Spongiactinospora rosea TaxID=2248750 RepID=A0A366LY34_9ACTN|nr:hypothetical protein DP939_18295 [Spongiactinospora rosea]